MGAGQSDMACSLQRGETGQALYLTHLVEMSAATTVHGGASLASTFLINPTPCCACFVLKFSDVDGQLTLTRIRRTMHFLFLSTLIWSVSLPLSQAAETVLGVYIFSRHGDRTAKATPPTNLTDLGYREVFDSGTWFRNKYISSSATNRIAGINTDLVKLAQIAASAPLDNVLMSSAQGFLQGLYPPVGRQLGSQFLANGTVVQAPLDGYQLIPIQTVTSGTGSEDSAWLQGAGNCANALVSSNKYFISPEYKMLLDSTQGFYSRLQPVVDATFNASKNNFFNAYSSMAPFVSTLYDRQKLMRELRV